MVENLADMGRTFKRARLLLDLTQEQVAQHVGMTRSQICLIEQGKSYPRQTTEYALRDALGLTNETEPLLFSIDDVVQQLQANAAIMN